MKKLLITIMTCLMLFGVLTPIAAQDGDTPTAGYVYGQEVTGNVKVGEVSDTITHFTVDNSTILTLDVESVDALVTVKVYDSNHEVVDEISTTDEVDGVILVFEITPGIYTIEVEGIEGEGTFSYVLTREDDITSDGIEKEYPYEGTSLPVEKPKELSPDTSEARRKRGPLPSSSAYVSSNKFGIEKYVAWPEWDFGVTADYAFEMYVGEVYNMAVDFGDWDFDANDDIFYTMPAGSSFDSNVPSVVSTTATTGILTAKAPGYARLTFTIRGVTETIDILVSNVYLVTEYMYDHYTPTWLGEKIQVKLEGKDSHLPTTYTSTNPSIVKVDSSGKATALKPGTAYIIAKRGSYSDMLEVKVYPPEFLWTSYTSYVGCVEDYFYIMGGTGTVKWTSSNKKVATVNSKGVITPLAKGTATITATVNGYKLKGKLVVLPNSVTLPYNSDVRSYPYGIFPSVVPSKAYYSGKTFKVDTYIMNNCPYKLTRFKNIKLYAFVLDMYDPDYYLDYLGYKNFKNVKLNIKAYKSKKITFSFSGSATYRPGFPLPLMYDYDGYFELFVGGDSYVNFTY